MRSVATYDDDDHSERLENSMETVTVLVSAQLSAVKWAAESANEMMAA